METKVEGVVISKTPYKERDLICNLLLRSGEKISVMFYGGQGGGRKKKSSIIELGFLLGIELGRPRNMELFRAKEYNLKWYHRKIRNNHQAFYLMNFFCELISKVALDTELDSTGESEGNFRVLSNALFHLDNSLSSNNFVLEQHLFMFLSKMIFELGISPSMQECVLCGLPLAEQLPKISGLIPDQGGFACGCSEGQEWGEECYHNLRRAWNCKYEEFQKLQVSNKFQVSALFAYLCYHTNLEQGSFKSIATILV